MSLVRGYLTTVKSQRDDASIQLGVGWANYGAGPCDEYSEIRVKSARFHVEVRGFT